MIEGKISQANGRLKAAAVGVRIEAMGDRLYLRATLPPRPDSRRATAYQQRIALHYRANPYGVSLAEKEARKIGALIDCGEFDWKPYLGDRPVDTSSIGYWLAKFEAMHRSEVSEITWKTEYAAIFKRLDPEQPLTEDVLRSVIDAATANSRQRRRCCITLGKLARFAGLTVDFKLMQGRSTQRNLSPRELPTDSEIAAYYDQISDPGWRWVYGMLATFGLRNHEAFFLDTELLMQDGYLVTVRSGKTGRRLVWACYPEWIEQFNLRDVQIPAVTGKSHADYGHRVSQFFRRAALPFNAYDLRHRWAVRTLEFGLDVSLAAQQMGHSVKVHCDCYHHWITADVHQRAFEALMLRGDRPLPPR